MASASAALRTVEGLLLSWRTEKACMVFLRAVGILLGWLRNGEVLVR
jgi:hypothetical protein